MTTSVVMAFTSRQTAPGTQEPSTVCSGHATVPMRLSANDFEQLVADALDGLPADLGTMMDNVAVVVEDRPTPEQLGGGGGTLLGLYEGVALPERSPLSYTATLPDRITIFRLPICELAENEAQLLDLVRTTVIHEVAHHFGISDERLAELGWQ